jgi:two-component system, NarL family, invasion response regulator UvrY
MKRILLIEDHEVTRIGLKQVVEESFPATTWGETDSAQEALALAHQREWDIILLELSINSNRGLELLKDLKSTCPKVPILIVTGLGERPYAFRAIKAGANGYVGKASPASELLRAVKKVLQGGRYVSNTLAESLTADLHRKGPDTLHELLSDREFQVLRLIGSGKTVGEIAEMLAISDKTVSTYRARVLDKTGLRNNAEVVRYVVEHSLVD